MSTAVIDRVLDPFTECLSPDVARRIVDLRADREVQEALDRLAEKANEGTLSEAERAEYEEYLQVLHFVTILQAKARRYLKSRTIQLSN
jgi:hypothetical protein